MQLHHLLNSGAEVNQRDSKGFTALHRTAYLAHLDGYLELYEYLLSRGADPAVRSEDYDPYLSPGTKLPVEVAVEDGPTRRKLLELEAKYAGVTKVGSLNIDVGMAEKGKSITASAQHLHTPTPPHLHISLLRILTPSLSVFHRPESPTSLTLIASHKPANPTLHPLPPHSPQAGVPHPDVGDWWALYDYGLEAIRQWPAGFEPPYPEALRRQRDREEHRAEKAERRRK